ncbi:hypothetical protein DFH07DRAFT_1058453 [Mycena maculata]|uniref:Uncharacterized protein n=1 Tax=Mycena maculata TaxID=230809 RepID=A0AAD7JMD9_9AGAR|nr:hypothetical protein DFH07DRAFT_1058453 [Mycena maculata]
MHFILFLLALFAPKLAVASLYPTNPTASTSVEAGTPLQITWEEGHGRPQLINIGLLEILLYTPDDEYVATLAHVSAITRIHTALMPPNCTHGTYVIIFKSKTLPKDVYTANFVVTPAITDSALPYVPPQLGADDLNATHPLLTLVLPSSTIVSDLAPTLEFAAATTISASPLPVGGGGGANLNRVHSPSSGANPRKASDFRNARFRLLFVVWPALIGISMAL